MHFSLNKPTRITGIANFNCFTSTCTSINLWGGRSVRASAPRILPRCSDLLHAVHLFRNKGVFDGTRILITRAIYEARIVVYGNSCILMRFPRYLPHRNSVSSMTKLTASLNLFFTRELFLFASFL